MGGNSLQQPTVASNYKIVTLSELGSLSSEIDTFNLGAFAQFPKEIIYLILHILDPLASQQLKKTSHSFRNFFFHTVAYFSNKDGPNLVRYEIG